MVVRQVKHEQAVHNHIEQCQWDVAVVAALVIINGCAVLGCERGVNVSHVDDTGVLVMSFVGPILSGCLIVLKI
jgi:hypothetical protein